MTPRSDWAVAIDVVLARIDSMDPGGASADAAELVRIANAAQSIGQRLWIGFGAGEYVLAGRGAVAADAAGVELSRRLTDSARPLQWAGRNLTGAASDLAATAAVRPQVIALHAVNSGNVAQHLQANQMIAAVMNSVYSDPMAGHADLSGAVPPAGADGRDAAERVGPAGPPAAETSRAPGAAPNRSPGPLDAAGPVPAAPAPGRAPPSPGPVPVGGEPGSPGAAGTAPPAPPGPAGTGAYPAGPTPARVVPAAHGAPGVVPVAGPPLGVPPVGGAPQGPAGLWTPGTVSGPAVATPGPTAASRVPSPTGPASGVAPPGSTQSRPSAVAPSPGARGSSGLPPAAGLRGARDDEERRRPDYLVSTQSAVDLIGPLPLAGPPVLGEPTAGAPDASDPELDGSGPVDADEDDQDLDLTL